jgi:hypothetical protein
VGGRAEPAERTLRAVRTPTQAAGSPVIRLLRTPVFVRTPRRDRSPRLMLAARSKTQSLLSASLGDRSDVLGQSGEPAPRAARAHAELR